MLALLGAQHLGESARVQLEIGNRAPAAGGLLGRLLDQDGDGDVADDVTKMGLDFLGKYLSRGR